MVLRIVFLALVAQFVPSAPGAARIGAETGAFFYREYIPKTYQAAPQNWAVVQDHRGVIYVGNEDGVLEYDGQRWRKLKLPKSSVARSLAVDAQGTVYVGGQGEIGFLKANETGTLEYVSLLDRVDPHDRVFSDVWTTLSTSSGIVFSSHERILRWSPHEGMKVWKPLSIFSSAFLVNNVPHVVQKGLGLYRLNGDSLDPVPGGEILARATTLHGLFEFSGSMMAATSDALYIERNGRFQEFRTEAKALLHDSRINRCLPLDNGTLAVGTVHRGVVLLSAQGKILRVLTHGNSINGMYRDREGGLWLALNNGLARIDISAAVTRFTEREGLGEIVISIRRQDGTLYAGTMSGLSRLNPSGNGTARFEPVPGIHGQVLVLLPTKHGMLVGSPGGIQQVAKNGVHELSLKEPINDMTVSMNDASKVYAAGPNGLYALRLSAGVWEQTQHVDSGGNEFLSVLDEPDGRVWATTLSDIWRLDFSGNRVRIERFSKEQGVPGGWKHAYRLRSSVLFATEKGLFRFDSSARRFRADTAFGSEFTRGVRSISMMHEAPGGVVWITGDGYHGVLRPAKSGGYTWNENVLGNYGIKELYGVYVDPDNTVWAAGTDGGLVRYEPSDAGEQAGNFRALLREMRIAGRESTIFGGAEGLAAGPKLRYQDNAVHFEFAAPLFEGVSETQFRVLLEGLGRTWSPWTTRSEKEYTNLWEGNYAVHVQARDSGGRLSKEAIFAFHVLPPLYRRWWAYFLYAAAALAMLWLIVKWRLLAIEATNRRLESLVEERTEQIRQQRDEIIAQEEEAENLLLNILPAAVANELRRTGRVTPMLCDNITVCFTDFVGFTLSSERMSAAELVEALNRYFTEFDKIVARYGLEKVKTIGDSYMFVSGLPQPRPSHAVDAVFAALEIVEAVERLADSAPGWQIRVGVHSGPVVAGVVGLHKFAFDIWGKTVNFASRHESSGTPNCVNISEQTYHLIRDSFHCEARGPVLIKEGRYLEMYLVRSVRATPPPEPDRKSLSASTPI